MKTTKQTFILTNLTDHFYEKLDSIESNFDKWVYLLSQSKHLDRCIKCSLHNGNTNIRSRIEWNAIIKKYAVEKLQPDYKIESRKGYKLVTFLF